MHQVRCDGHEKLGALALDLGGLKLDIYLLMDQSGSTALYGACVPNGRLIDVIDHVYLDLAGRFVVERSCRECDGSLAPRTTV